MRQHHVNVFPLLVLWICTCVALPGQVQRAVAWDRDKFEQLITQSAKVGLNDPGRGLELAEEAMQWAEASGNLAQQLQAFTRLGEALIFSSQYERALEVLESGLALPLSSATRVERAWLLYQLGRVSWHVSDYPKAESCFIEVQKAAEAFDDPLLLARVSNSRGILASNQRQTEVAKEQYQKALALAEAWGDDDLRAKVLNNLALVFRDEGRAVEAKRLFEANLELHRLSNNRRGMANALINLSSVETVLNHHAEALRNAEEALNLRIQIGVPRHIASARIMVASCLARVNRAPESLAQLNLAVPTVTAIDSAELSGNLFAAFSEAYAANEDFASALKYQRMAEAEKSAVAGVETAKLVAELRERFGAEKRQREIAELKSDQIEKAADLALSSAELRRTQQQRYGLILVLVLGAITVTAVIGRTRARARAERLILVETQRARDLAEETAALKSRLIDVVSHDLKNPLIGFMMTADIIGDASLDPKVIAERGQALKQESQRMFELVQDILDSSAAESGRIALDCRPIDLAELVSAQLADWRNRAAGKRQHVQLKVEKGADYSMEGDAARLRQVTENLVSNAMKFSPEGSEIVIRMTGDEYVSFEVLDQGPGFSEADLKNLFSAYQKLSATPTGGESSNGLGLVVAQSLTRLHGGKLRAENGQTEGACLIAEFPRTQAIHERNDR